MNAQEQPSAADRLIQALQDSTTAQTALTRQMAAQTEALGLQAAAIERLVQTMALDDDDLPEPETYLNCAPRR